MKIALARLRYNVRYSEPLNDISDSFFECYKNFIKKHKENEYLYHKFSFDGKTPQKSEPALRDSEVIIISSESEFQAHVPNYLHPMNLKKSNDELNSLIKHFDNKKIILLQSDRADTPELYRDFTLKDAKPKSIVSIDEDDFPVGIHVMKYHFIKELPTISIFGQERDIDFTYWGTEKRKLPGGAPSGDERHKILKEISKLGFQCRWVGRFSNIERDFPMLKMRDMIKPLLNRTLTTICFNWMSNTAVTSRYHEAMACGIVPLVWKDYDSTNRLNIMDWQRCRSSDEIRQKICEVQNDPEIFKEIENNYLKVLTSYEETVKLFEKKLLCHIAS